ncbi:hypothetical protein [Halostagnicola bangensis]
MSGSTSDSAGVGPFSGGFGIGAAAVGVVSILIGLLAAVDGYTEMGMLVTGDDPILEGVIILTFGVGIGVVALFAGAYMEPGFGGDDHEH